MAEFTLGATQIFPPGTSVGAYEARSAQPPLGAPTTAVVDTQTMGTASLTFEDLTEGVRYWAYAAVDGSHRYVTFTAGADLDVEHSAGIFDDITVLGTLGVQGSAEFEDPQESETGFRVGNNYGLGTPVTGHAHCPVDLAYVENADAPGTKILFARTCRFYENGDPPDVALGRGVGIFPDGLALDTTLAADVTLPQATIALTDASRLGTQAGASLLIGSGTSAEVVTFTGVASNNVTGCAGGTGTWPAGTRVQAISGSGITIGIQHWQPWSGATGGFQDRIAQIHAQTTEAHRSDGQGGFFSGGRFVISTTSPGPKSARRQRMIFRDNGCVGIVGADTENDTEFDAKLTVFGHGARLSGAQATNIATIRVNDNSGFPSSGTLDINGQTVTYTGKGTGTDLNCTFTGCSGGSATVEADGRAVYLISPHVAIASKRSIAAMYGSTRQVRIGLVGPTTTPGSEEPGIEIGGSGGKVILFRSASQEARFNTDTKLRLVSATGTTIVQQTDNGGVSPTPTWQRRGDGKSVTSAANEQTTVGAAGAASPLPGDPRGYEKFVDSTGTVCVRPYWAAS